MSCSHNIIFINQGCLMTTHLIPDHEEKTYRNYCFYGFHVILVILFKISYIFLQYPEHKYQQFNYFIIIWYSYCEFAFCTPWQQRLFKYQQKVPIQNDSRRFNNKDKDILTIF